MNDVNGFTEEDIATILSRLEARQTQRNHRGKLIERHPDSLRLEAAALIRALLSMAETTGPAEAGP